MGELALLIMIIEKQIDP